MVGLLSVPSGRFARGTVVLACYFLCKAMSKLYALKVEKPNVSLHAPSVHFRRDAGPLVKQSREVTLIRKTHT